MSHAEFIEQYSVPVARKEADRPVLEWSRRGEGRLRALQGRARRRLRGRRLAYIDSHFPWKRSGFRYADALALHEARPDTVFFSMYAMRDPFPAPVLPLAAFPRLAPSLGITDVYGVFLLFMGGVLGLYRHSDQAPHPTQGLDLSGILEREGIRAHAGLYPGGGFIPDEHGFAEARRLVAAADRVFSWIPSVLDVVAGVTPIDPAVIDTQFYAKTTRDFTCRPLELLFAADAKPRKGLAVALEAIRQLPGEPVHLHIVGPHDRDRARFDDRRTTFHGWLERDELKALHRRCHVFLSPVTAELPGDPAGDSGVVDGFPTAAAAEAMSSGLLLITSNPEGDHRQLRPGTDHVEVPATADAFAGAIDSALSDPHAAANVAEEGSRRVRERLDVRAGAAARLELMGFKPGYTPYAPPVRAPRPAAHVGSGEAQRAGEIQALHASLAELRAEHDRLADDVRAIGDRLIAVGQAALDDESATWRALQALRASAGYDAAFIEPDPLVSICIPTYTNHVQLIERSIPSALAQDHRNIEVVVVGDAAPPETAAAIEQLGDPRVRYENLATRGPYPDDPHERWLVAGTAPMNRALQLARGAWIAINNDDDEMRPNHVSTLLAEAQRSRDEVVYGRLLEHSPDGSTQLIGVFPPQFGGFGWQVALQHNGMRLFEFKLSAALFDEPGDWNRARRMLRAGVRFRMVDQVVCDYYPSRLWQTG